MTNLKKDAEEVLLQNVHEAKGLEDLGQININNIMGPLSRKAKEFIIELLGLSCSIIKNTELYKLSRLTMLKATSYIDMRGALTGRFIMSVDELLLKDMVRHLVLEDLTEEEIISYMEDTLGECLNIILGNSIKLFSGTEEPIFLDAPISMTCNNGQIKYPKQEIWTSYICCERLGSASISFVPL